MKKWIFFALLLSLSAAAEETIDAPKGITLRSGETCYVLEFEQTPSEVFSCFEPLPLKYEVRDCGSGKATEKGEAKALVSCEEKKSYTLHLRTQAGVISARLKSRKVPHGKSGAITEYAAESVSSGSKFESLLPAPTLLSLDGKVPEEKPLEFKFSGFMTMEYERSERFGYDTGGTGTAAAPNFSESVDRPRRSTGSLFSNFNFSLHKDRTSIQSILEVGEIYFGDSATGGAQGARASNLLEVRNLYLEHSVTDSLKAKAGIITAGTDPRGFIYSDHTASTQLAYESTLANALVWYGTAQKSRPAAANYLHDSFLSVQANLNFLFGLKNTIFYAERNQANATLAQALGNGTFGTLNGRNQAHWLGGTFAYTPDPLSFEATFIGNWNRFRTPGLEPNTQFGFLADAKASAGIADSKFVLTAEGLATSGTKAASNGGNKILGKRGSFVSPVGAAYLLTVATNDGVDDAAGTPKQSIIADLNLDEGLRILVGTAAWNISKRWSAFLRGGVITSAAESALNSNQVGREIDLGGIYQLTPSATMGFDYGYFKPGAFFANHSPASLGSLKYKFSF